MWNIPTENQLSRIPKLYETAHIKTTEKIIYMHFFLGGSDWYMAEYSPEERIFFGFAILNDDFNMAEWGYISFDELIDIKAGFVDVDRELNWKPIPFYKIDKIAQYVN